MATRPPVELTADQRALADVAGILRDESDGKTLRRDLNRALKAAAEAPIQRAKEGIMSVPSKGLTQGQPLRSTVAASIKPISRLSGTSTGVSIRQTRTPGLRGFQVAGRKFNRASFRHRVFGTDRWVEQNTFGNAWFDRPMQDAAPDFKAEVLRVVQDLADTLAARARSAGR